MNENKYQKPLLMDTKLVSKFFLRDGKEPQNRDVVLWWNVIKFPYLISIQLYGYAN